MKMFRFDLRRLTSWLRDRWSRRARNYMLQIYWTEYDCAKSPGQLMLDKRAPIMCAYMYFNLEAHGAGILVYIPRYLEMFHLLKNRS